MARTTKPKSNRLKRGQKIETIIDLDLIRSGNKITLAKGAQGKVVRYLADLKNGQALYLVSFSPELGFESYYPHDFKEIEDA
jgi:hypothetical protein